LFREAQREAGWDGSDTHQAFAMITGLNFMLLTVNTHGNGIFN